MERTCNSIFVDYCGVDCLRNLLLIEKLFVLSVVAFCFASFLPNTVSAAEFTSKRIGFFTVGGGPQPNGHQSHRTVGVDMEVWQFKRTPRQEISIGVSYTYLSSSRGPQDVLHALSLYPQLTLLPLGRNFLDSTLIGQYFPRDAVPYFFVRALGPSYISENTLGSREQDNHFAFQALFGVGLRFSGPRGGKRYVAVSWKHFSNANIFSDNDGIDIPVVLSFGAKF